MAPDAADENLSVVENFLDSLGAEYIEIFIKQDSKPEVLSKDVQNALSASHCIVLNSCKMHDKCDYGLYLGIMIGNGAGTFIYTGKQDGVPRYRKIAVDGQSFFHCYNDIETLLKYVGKNYPLYVIEDKQHVALKKLLTMGIPFTGDSFADYIAKDKTEICNLFLEAGMISTAYTGNGVPVLCVAARNDCFDKVKWLVENGADVNAISEDRGYSAVMDAVWRKNYDVTRYLIEHGSDLSIISSDGQPILVLAVGNENVRIVQLLLESGADPDIKDSMGMSARGYVNLFKKPAMVKLMEKYPPKE